MTTSINKIMKNRKNKKGFSLIELIVVLVIMAILAAALVPTLIGYINQTRQSTAKNEAAACVSATQTIVSSAYADPDGIYHNNSGGTNVKLASDTLSAVTSGAKVEDVILALAEVKGTLTDVTVENGVVKSLKYTTKDAEFDVTYSTTATELYAVSKHTSGS